MASRGSVGGLAPSPGAVCDVLDAFGFDRILIETVGVGQSGLDIAGMADSTVVVLVPESGDGIQALKAGIMEIADLYVVNKADRPGAHRLVQELEIMLGLRKGQAYRHVAPHHHVREGDQAIESSTASPPYRLTAGEAGEAKGAGEWEPPVITTVATKGEGIGELVEHMEARYADLQRTGELAVRRRERLARHTRDVVIRSLRARVWDEGDGEAILAQGLDDVVAGRTSPYELAGEIVAGLQREN
jgi:LAO/AO transport system kinase